MRRVRPDTVVSYSKKVIGVVREVSFVEQRWSSGQARSNTPESKSVIVWSTKQISDRPPYSALVPRADIFGYTPCRPDAG